MVLKSISLLLSGWTLRTTITLTRRNGIVSKTINSHYSHLKCFPTQRTLSVLRQTSHFSLVLTTLHLPIVWVLRAAGMGIPIKSSKWISGIIQICWSMVSYEISMKISRWKMKLKQLDGTSYSANLMIATLHSGLRSMKLPHTNRIRSRTH